MPGWFPAGLFVSPSCRANPEFARSPESSRGNYADAELSRYRRRYRSDPNTHSENRMDWNRIEGNWKQAKGKIKEKWGQLTDDDLTHINGKREQLEGRIQERYGLAKDMVRKDVDDWLKAQDKAA